MERKYYAFLCAGMFISAFLLISYASWPFPTPLSGYIAQKDDYRKKTETVLDEVAADIAKIREIDTPDSIEYRIVTVDWVKENWGRRATDAEIEEIRLEEEIYRALFLIPKDFSLVELKVQQAGTIMAAVAGDTLYFVREYFNPYDEENARELLAHEIAHILQSRNYRIEEPGEFDAKQVKNALIEGEAEFTKEEYVRYKFNRTVEESFSLPSGNVTLRDTDALWQLWVAPGIYGREFVRALNQAGGWERINEAFINMPLSMEQIMHPEKYLNGEGFTTVENGEVKGWDLKRSERFGEHFILMVLARHIPVDEAEIASEGWAGDGFTYYRRDGEYLFLWKIFWDSPIDRDEFISAFKELLRNIKSEEIAPNEYKTYNGYLILKIDHLSVTITGTSKPDFYPTSEP